MNIRHAKSWVIYCCVLFVITMQTLTFAHKLTIVSDSVPKAVIVLPEQPLECQKEAANELQYYVKTASGALLEIIPETQSDKVSVKTYIYVGNCKKTQQLGISPASLARNGYILRAVDNAIFIVGRDISPSRFGFEDYVDSVGTGAKNSDETGTLYGVYDLITTELKIRWFWPGKLGEEVPKSKTIVFNSKYLDRSSAAALKTSLYHPSFNSKTAGWCDQRNRVIFSDEEDLWLKRHCFSWDENFRSAHSFENYWERFSKSNPEFFSMLPDGSRRSDPYYCMKGDPKFVSMCVSSPELHRQIVQDWKNTKNKYMMRDIHAGENDTPGCCCCPRCLSWDVPDERPSDKWAKRVELAKKAFEQQDGLWTRHLGSLSDRYARFYMEIYKLVSQIDPNVIIHGFAYANYTQAPIKTKLNKNIVIAYVPSLMYPWTSDKIKHFKNDWNGWAETGCRLLLRPNFTLDGHNMPIFYARHLGSLVNHCYTNAMIGTEFDSRTGQYAIQGPNLYVIARMNSAPWMRVDKVLDEYYSAFGPAESEVRKYFNFWERVSDSATDQMCSEAKGSDPTAIVAGWDRFFVSAPNIFTQDKIEFAVSILEKAAEKTESTTIYRARVKFLQQGLKHAALTLQTQKAYTQFEKDARLEAFKVVLQNLDEYRQQNEADSIANMGYLYWAEEQVWNREKLLAN